MRRFGCQGRRRSAVVSFVSTFGAQPIDAKRSDEAVRTHEANDDDARRDLRNETNRTQLVLFRIESQEALVLILWGQGAGMWREVSI